MNIHNLLTELKRHKERHELWPQASTEDVAETERAIGIALPESYRQFVTQFSNGAFLFSVQEVCAVGEGHKQISPIQQVFHRSWTTGRILTREELEMEIPFREGGMIKRKYLVPFSLDSNGNEWCFLVENWTAREEYPVAYLDTRGMRLYGKLRDFAIWLGILIESEREVIRALYEEYVLTDELGLG